MARLNRLSHKRDERIRYVITDHGHLSGVRLSKLGHWCNVAFDSEKAAQTALKRDAGTNEHSIERRSYPALPAFDGQMIYGPGS